MNATSAGQVVHATGNLKGKRHQVLLRECFLLFGRLSADYWLVAGRGTMVPKEVAQIAVRGELHDHVEWTTLRTCTEQINYVYVFANHLHHLHFGHQIHHLGVSVTLCNDEKLFIDFQYGHLNRVYMHIGSFP